MCSDAHVTTVIPLVFKYCQQAFSKQDETLSGVSKHLGKLCQGLAGAHCLLYLFINLYTIYFFIKQQWAIQPLGRLHIANLHTRTHAHTHAHTRLMALFPGLPGWAGTRKVKPILDFTEATDPEWQWHQLGHMQVCTSLQTNNHASTPPLSFYRLDALPAAQPTASKHWRH